MSPVLEWLNGCLKEIQSQAFKDVISVEKVEEEPMGDGQLVVISDIKRVTLTLVKSNGEKVTLKTIAKLEAQSTAGREMAAACEAFPTETKMYCDILKRMEKMLTDVGEKQYPWAECYLSCKNKLLFQDLCEEEYKVVPTYNFLDLDHALLVMKAIGKFHGLSMAFKDRASLKSSQFAEPFYVKKIPFMHQMFFKTIETFAKSIEDHWGPEWASVPERLTKYLENTGEKLHSAWESCKDKWQVLNHGDFSMRNMLFHYNPDSSKPDFVKFVDFQMCHYSNLGNDLALLLYSSVRPTVRTENWQLLLQTYVKSLSSTAQIHGYQGLLPTVDDVKESLHSLAPLTVVIFSVNIPTFVTSGKMNLQEKADEYLQKYENLNDTVLDEQSMSHLLFTDPEVKDMLQLEIQRCLNEKIF